MQPGQTTTLQPTQKQDLSGATTGRSSNVVVHEDPNSSRTSEQILNRANDSTTGTNKQDNTMSLSSANSAYGSSTLPSGTSAGTAGVHAATAGAAAAGASTLQAINQQSNASNSTTTVGSTTGSGIQANYDSSSNTMSDRLNQTKIFDSSSTGHNTAGETAAQIRNDLQNADTNGTTSSSQSGLYSTGTGTGTTGSVNNSGEQQGGVAGTVAAVSGAAAAAGATASQYLNRGVESVKQATGLNSTSTTGTTSTYNSTDAQLDPNAATAANSTGLSNSSTSSQYRDSATGADGVSYGDASRTGIDSTRTGNTQGAADAKDFAATPASDTQSGGLRGAVGAAVATATGAAVAAGAYASQGLNSAKQAVGMAPDGNPQTGNSSQYRDERGNAAALNNSDGKPSYGDASASGIDSTQTGNTVGQAGGHELAAQPTSDSKKQMEAAVAGASGTAAAGAAATGVSTGSRGAASRAKIYIVYYSTYTHMHQLAHAIKKGAEAYGADVSVYQVPETLPTAVLQKMHAPEKSSDPVIAPAQLAEADGVIFGFPTRFGMSAAQMKGLLDSTGQLWAKGALLGKTASTFFGTATQAGGQETTAMTFVTQLTHHGMLFVPIGYSNPALFSEELHGGSPWGAGTLAAGDGSRQPSELEIGVAEHQGKHFAEVTTALKAGRAMTSSQKAQ